MTESKDKADKKQLSEAEIAKCILILEALNADTNQIYDLPEEVRVSLMTAAGLLSRPSREEFLRRRKDSKKAQKRKQKERDRHARKETGIRSARESTVFVAPPMIALTGDEDKETKRLSSPRNCYVCKTKYHYLHHFYDSMCEECGDFNYAKRYQSADMTGQVAIVTGSRLKIGYHITLMMLKAGATVVATTRFPVDSALRYSKEPDFTDWGHRLKIHGLDLRHIPSVEIFCNYIEQQYDRLDVLINNAAQTVRRPATFYKHLMSNEDKIVESLPEYTRDLLKDHHDCLEELRVLSQPFAEGQQKNLPVSWHGKQFVLS